MVAYAARGKCVSRWLTSGFVAGVARETLSASAVVLGKSSGAATRGPRRVVQYKRDRDAAARGASESVEHERHVERIRCDQHLRRGQRLRSARDFGRARGRGRRVGGQLITLTYARQAQAAAPGPARVGVVAGKRVGGAVTRNRVKRRLREVLRRELASIPAGWDLVCDAKPAAAEVPYAALEAELRALLARAGLLLGPAVPDAVRDPLADGQPSGLAAEAGQNRSKQP